MSKQHRASMSWIGERSEVVAALSPHRGRGAAKPTGYTRPAPLAGECTFILVRIEVVPNFTLRTLIAELSARGDVGSYGALWNFVHHQGLSFTRPTRPNDKQQPALELIAAIAV